MGAEWQENFHEYCSQPSSDAVDLGTLQDPAQNEVVAGLDETLIW